MTDHLLERRDVLRGVHRLLEDARGGRGSVLVLEGAAGVGKTSLLDAAAAAARDGGMRVGAARPTELEREFPFGVVRQLFAPLAGRCGDGARRRGARGPAAAARRMLAGAGAGPSAAARQAVAFGLLWLLADIAAPGGVLLAVDDAQWADDASAAWLSYLGGRIPELPVALLVATRPVALRECPALAGLPALHPAVRLVPVRPLGREATAAVLARRLGAAAAGRIADVAYAATGGNPLLLEELARARAAGLSAEPPTTERLRRTVALRVAEPGPGAARLARAVAVLGGADVPLGLAGALAGVDAGVAADAADALTRAEILRAEPGLSFVHPLVRDALAEGMGPAELQAAHARAARLLHDAGEPGQRVAAHLLAAAPAADAWALERLRTAARTALAGGAPAEAVRLLRRALAEPPARAARGQILRELGEAEALAGDPAAEARLREAVAASAGREAAEVALVLARVLVGRGAGAAALQVLELALPAAREEPELELRLLTEGMAAARAEPGLVPPALPPGRAPDALTGDTPAERTLLAACAFEAAAAGEHHVRAAALAERALAGGRLLREEGPESRLAVFTIASLGYLDRHAAALGHLDMALEHARASGSAAAYALARAWRADILMRTGALANAEADALEALALAEEHELAPVAAVALLPLLVVLVEQERLDEAERTLAAQGFARQIPAAGLFAGVGFARGRLRAAQGRPEAAAADLEAAGTALLRGRVQTPAIVPWRSEAALALALTGARAEAVALAAEELALARGLAAPRPLGLALRAQALVGPAEARVAGLRDAADALRDAPAPVDLARALADLGVAEVRAGERPAGREHLREALDLADRHGAVAIARHAHRELVVAGARPRRARTAGRDALTAAEDRVARLAAGGRTNREIAAELFLTLKTIETHLGRVYAKLSVSGRRELAGVLGPED